MDAQTTVQPQLENKGKGKGKGSKARSSSAAGFRPNSRVSESPEMVMLATRQRLERLQLEFAQRQQMEIVQMQATLARVASKSSLQTRQFPPSPTTFSAKAPPAEASQPPPLPKRADVRVASEGALTRCQRNNARQRSKARAARDELAKLKTALASGSESEVKAAEGSAGST